MGSTLEGPNTNGTLLGGWNRHGVPPDAAAWAIAALGPMEIAHPVASFVEAHMKAMSMSAECLTARPSRGRPVNTPQQSVGIVEDPTQPRQETAPRRKQTTKRRRANSTQQPGPNHPKLAVVYSDRSVSTYY
jgi:hypothetical protein